MKVIGLIGGMSWNSTLEYYRIINESVAHRLGSLHSAHLVLYNLDFDEIQRVQHEGRWDDTAGILIDAGNAVKRAGAEGIVLGCTELPLLVRPSEIHAPVFDTTRFHAEAAVNLALSED